MKPLIAVSLLSSNFGNLNEELRLLKEANADLLHLDVMDGHFVPNLTFGLPLIKAISSATDIPLDAHLMVTNPQDYIEPFSSLGVKYFSFHQETVFHSHRLVQQIKQAGMLAGIALNPATSLETIYDILPDLDFVLIMSVNPGYSGQAFIPSALSKVRRLKQMIITSNLKTLIQVDGGITDKNSKSLIEAGADILVSASYIFSHNDYSIPINRIKQGVI